MFILSLQKCNGSFRHNASDLLVYDWDDTSRGVAGLNGGKIGSHCFQKSKQLLSNLGFLVV